MPAKREHRDVAIIGMGSLFADSTTNESFWQHIVRGDDLITEVPPDRWSLSDYYDPDPKKDGKTYANRGSFVPDVWFNPIEFGIPPNNLSSTDTAQLLALVVAKKVLEQASEGHSEELDRDRVSVILGVASATEMVNEMSGRLQRPLWEHALRDYGVPDDHVEKISAAVASSYAPWNENTFPGLLGNVVAGRIANRLDLRGTNTVLDAACASSLAAISMAVMELQLGRCDLAISGGVDALNDIFMYMCFSKTPALSATGDCRPFSGKADGTLLGEGIGMFALKRLDDAERDNDNIYAVIKGIGTSSDGHSKSVYAPNSSGQAKAIRAAYEAAGYGPETVELLEAHGTGTKAGDAAEFEGLRSVYAPVREDRQWCALGSIKSQIGHTKGAAGAAGLFKAAMALHHAILPPTIKVEQPNPELGIDSSPFYLNTKARPWIRDRKHPRRASVSAFGFGGTNFHLAVEEYTGRNQAARYPVFPSYLFVWSAESASSLVESCRKLLDTIASFEESDLLNLSRKTQLSASLDQSHRLAIIASDGQELKGRLEEAARRLTDDAELTRIDTYGLSYSAASEPGKVAFLFPGQGSQYVAMGADVAMAFPAARRIWDELGTWSKAELPLHRVVFPPPVFDEQLARQQTETLKQTEWAQPALAACSLSYLQVLERLGVKADCVGGHSFGEVVALHAAGVLSESDCLSVAATRGTLMAGATRAPGAMTAVFHGAREVEELYRANAIDVEVVNYNSPGQCVISGTVASVEEFESALQSKSMRFQRLAVATAFHSPIVAPAAEEFARYLEGLRFRKPRIAVFANSTAEPYEKTPAKMRTMLAGQIAKPVRFEQELQAMYAAGARTFIEVGPGSVLTGLVRQCLPGESVSAVALDRRGQNGVTALWSALAHLWIDGVPLEFGSLWKGYENLPQKAPKDHPPAAVRINGGNYGRPYPERLPAVSDVKWNTADAALAVSEDTSSTTAFPAESELDSETTPIQGGSAKEYSMSDEHPSTNHHSDQTAILHTFQELQRQTAQAHTAFQESMTQSHREYLHASEKTFVAFAQFLSGRSADNVVSSDSQQRQWLPQPEQDVPTSRISSTNPTDATMGHGGDAVMAPHSEPSAQGAPDQGRIAAFPPAAPAVDKAPEPTSQSSPPAPGSDGAGGNEAGEPTPPPRPDANQGGDTSTEDVEKLMISVMSDVTGYPAEMLKKEMDLEADLGIDSIKRVEILSSVQDKLHRSLNVDQQEMASMRTIGEISDYINERVKKN